METWNILLFLSSCTVTITAELCTSQICEYHFVIRRWRSMTYSAPKAAYDVTLNGSRLQLTTNDFKPADDPLIGTFIDASDVITADGYTRDVITINDQFPGPTIEVMKDAQVVVHVKNELRVEGTTIHWHGLFMRHTPWMDGTAYVTQCPILPMQTFTYRFQADPPGTHWYHSHINAQKQDGLFGLLIVHERPPKLPSYGVTITDWLPVDAITLAIQNPYDPSKKGTGHLENGAPVRDYMVDNNELTALKFFSALINGRGRYDDDPYPLTEFTFVQGQRYRLRVVHAGMEFPFVISIDDHQLSVVGSDGDEYLPIAVDFVVLFPGESMDIEVTADQPDGSYWLRAELLRKGTGWFPVEDDTTKGTLAIIRYRDVASNGDPTSAARTCTEQTPCATFNCPFAIYPAGSWMTCIPLSDARSMLSNTFLDTAYGLQDKDSDIEEIFLNLAFPIGSSINGRKNVEPRAPMFTPDIEQYTTPCDDDACDRSGCLCTHIRQLPHNKTIQMVFSSYTPNENFMAHHDVHLHGHNFAVLRMGFAEQNETTGFWTRENQDITCTSENEYLCSKRRWNGGPPVMNKVKPPLKDTVMVPSRGYVVVRFRSDNPGFWFLHCHQQLHLMEGMNMIIEEAPGKVKPVPREFPRCGDFDWDNEEYQEYLNGEMSEDSDPNLPENEESSLASPDDDSHADEDVINTEKHVTKTEESVTMPLSMAIGVAFGFMLVGAFITAFPCGLYICCRNRKNTSATRQNYSMQ